MGTISQLMCIANHQVEHSLLLIWRMENKFYIIWYIIFYFLYLMIIKTEGSVVKINSNIVEE